MALRTTIKESLFLAVAILALAPSVRSHGATIVPDEDTFITTHTGLGGPASTHPSDAALYAIGQTSFISHTLLHFDLSAFTGQTAIGDATLSLFVSSVFGLTPARTVNSGHDCAVCDVDDSCVADSKLDRQSGRKSWNPN